ncbi:MAG TPA: serine/threonine-protein kinase [Phycisphaerae bacterium]|jgi:serine/threonine-protein kinase|nr:serine/threonine-protein kinase [Phycisphaerae bacterium]
MKKLDRFLLRDILSDGPAGTVYKADEILPGDNRRTVALKVLPAIESGAVTGESPSEKRFFGEVRVLAQLAVHPNVVTLYAMGVTDGYPWLAMEFSPATLAQKLSDTPAEPGEILRILEQCARGLLAMHSLKPALIHQDLKPANILMDALGNCKITDFSLATVTAAHKTHGIATVRYAAPELLSSEFGRVGPATDLYALGHIAYELALGQRALRAQFPAVFDGNAGKEPPPNKWMMWHASISMRPAPVASVLRGFPSALSEVISRLIAKPIEQRYNSADELLSDLSVLRGDLSASIAAPLPPASPPRESASAPRPAASRTQNATPPAPKSPAASSAGSNVGVAVQGAGGVYWVRLRGKVTGPFDLATLKNQVKQGQLSRLHQVSADQVVWKSPTEVDGLYGPTVV